MAPRCACAIVAAAGAGSSRGCLGLLRLLEPLLLLKLVHCCQKHFDAA